MKSLYLIPFLLLTTLSSCQLDQKKYNEFLCKEWMYSHQTLISELNKYKNQPNNEKLQRQQEIIVYELERSKFEFIGTGNFIVKHSLENDEIGNWEFSSNKDKLILNYSNGRTEKWDLKKITPDELTLSTIKEGQEYTITFIPQKERDMMVQITLPQSNIRVQKIAPSDIFE